MGKKTESAVKNPFFVKKITCKNHIECDILWRRNAESADLAFMYGTEIENAETAVSAAKIAEFRGFGVETPISRNRRRNREIPQFRRFRDFVMTYALSNC